MPMHLSRFISASVTAALWMSALSPAAAAADPPPLPSPPPFLPGTGVTMPPGPGSYTYWYNVIAVPAPASNDARGVRAASNADPSQSANGMPGSKLGNSAPHANILTSSNIRYNIAAGVTPPPSTIGPGINVSGGNQAAPLEDPAGQPPANTLVSEAVAPTTQPNGPGVPSPVLEGPAGQQSPVH